MVTRGITFRNPWVAAIAIVVLGIVEYQAIAHQIDGAYMAAIVAAIAGIAGYAVQPGRNPE